MKIQPISANCVYFSRKIDMFAIALLFVYIFATSAKVMHLSNHRNTQENVKVLPKNTTMETWDDTLWVIKLNGQDFNLTYLRSATEYEEEFFDTVIGPMIHRHPLAYFSYKRRQESKRVKKDDPNKCYPFDRLSGVLNPNPVEEIHDENNDEVKNEIIKIINKFVLSFQGDPDSYLTDTIREYDTPTLTLYFKGPFTSLVVNYERKIWQFFIRPPSPLPKWFYTEYSDVIIDKKGAYVRIPSIVREEFYEKLLHMLTMFLGFPI